MIAIYLSSKEDKMAEFYRKKKKVCFMCTTGKDINYKDVDILKKNK